MSQKGRACSRSLQSALIKHKATIFLGVPAMFSMMPNSQGSRTSAMTSSTSALLCSGSALLGGLRARFTQRFGSRANTRHQYAATEALTLCALMPEREDHLDSVSMPAHIGVISNGLLTTQSEEDPG
ncbi:AMP-binding protein [Rhizobium sp. 2YAF20]|uniref:AMP-binding protein n=1 Tax=Rhizobium sp. 2YAF20 TaxID=3233027 RepID=UPI003F9A4396